MDKHQKVVVLGLMFSMLLFGFAMGMLAEYARGWGQNERLFNLIRSEDVNKQACAEVAIKNNEPYNWAFINWCLRQASSVKESK